MMRRYVGSVGLMLAALLTALSSDAADQVPATTGTAAAKTPPPLVFWAVNEGGARIYQPNRAACEKISGLSVQYAEGVSSRFNVPAYTLKFKTIKLSADQSTCALLIDTPTGLRECTLGSVIRTFGGDYLAHTYHQFGDGSVQFMRGDCLHGSAE